MSAVIGRIALLVVSSVLLAACATDQPPIEWPAGFAETRLRDDLYRVKILGGVYADPSSGQRLASADNPDRRVDELVRRAIDLTLLRSAELTRERGYRFFVIVEPSVAGPSPVDVKPGAEELAAATSPTGEPYVSRPPHTANTVLMLHQKPASPIHIAYDADAVIRSLRDKYRLN